MIALAHDYRIMNSTKGWISFNEIFMNARLPYFVVELVKTKVASDFARQMFIVNAVRLVSGEAIKLGIIHGEANANDLEKTVHEFVEPRLKGLHPKTRWIVHRMKLDLYDSLVKQRNIVGFTENAEIEVSSKL